MKLDYQEMRDALTRAADMAMEVYMSNKEHGSPALSVAYDSGRIDGLRQSIEILDKLYDRS